MDAGHALYLIQKRSQWLTTRSKYLLLPPLQFTNLIHLIAALAVE